MAHLEPGILRGFGEGGGGESICRSAGWTRSVFDARWKAEAASRVPHDKGQFFAGVQAKVSIERDSHGIPHLFADNHHDLFFGFGYAMAQDRLFQLDWLRRK